MLLPYCPLASRAFLRLQYQIAYNRLLLGLVIHPARLAQFDRFWNALSLRPNPSLRHPGNTQTFPPNKRGCGVILKTLGGVLRGLTHRSTHLHPITIDRCAI